jgi:type IV pilus assembly protein PilE
MFDIKAKNKFFKKKVKGLTLMEMLVTLAIIGILVLTAMPLLMPLISKAKSTEATLQLEHLHDMEKTFFYLHSKYSTDLTEIGFEAPKLTTQGGNGNYQLEVVSATNNTFKAKATAITDFDGDGVFNVWEIDQDKNLKEVTPD